MRTTEVQHRLLEWGPRNFQRFPWRRRLPVWRALVTEILLQRTRAHQVVPVFNEFQRRYPTAESFASASESDIHELVDSLGLRWRAPLLSRLAKELGARRGRVPRDQKHLQKFPGVGPYVAAAALSLHGGTRAVIIDANVVRVLSRLVGREFDGESRRKRWIQELADELTPKDRFRDYNYALLDLAMTVCLPRRPRCCGCPLLSLCATGRGGLFVVEKPNQATSPGC